MNKVFLSVLIIIFVAAFAFFHMLMSSKSTPELGLVDGKLRRCPGTPNCVCSDESSGDDGHFVAPVYVAADINDETMAKIKNTVVEMGGTLRNEGQNYLAYTFSSKIFGFIDDMELRIEPRSKQIYIRSASRVGFIDFGTNRKRVETFRKEFNERLFK